MNQATIPVGQVFGRLTVVGRDARIPARKGVHWRVKCSCGSQEKTVAAKHMKRRDRHATVSCGCYRDERNSEKAKRRGEYLRRANIAARSQSAIATHALALTQLRELAEIGRRMMANAQGQGAA
jgi:hypothetical protein